MGADEGLVRDVVAVKVAGMDFAVDVRAVDLVVGLDLVSAEGLAGALGLRVAGAMGRGGCSGQGICGM